MRGEGQESWITPLNPPFRFAISAALSAVTAAIVGVILNLAVWFGLHTLFARVSTLRAGPLDMAWPDLASLDPASSLLSLVAVIALFRLKLGMIPTLVLCGAVGFAWRGMSGILTGVP